MGEKGCFTKKEVCSKGRGPALVKVEERKDHLGSDKEEGGPTEGKNLLGERSSSTSRSRKVPGIKGTKRKRISEARAREVKIRKTFLLGEHLGERGRHSTTKELAIGKGRSSSRP